MLRLGAKKTLSILFYLLECPYFTQSSVKKDLKVSIGQVNKVVTWLQKKGFVVKEGKQYVLAQPNRLADLIALAGDLEIHQEFHVKVDNPQSLLKFCTPCGETAFLITKKKRLESLDAIFSEKISNKLAKLSRGTFHVRLWKLDLDLPLASPITSIIELHMLGKKLEAEELGYKQWGTRQ